MKCLNQNGPGRDMMLGWEGCGAKPEVRASQAFNSFPFLQLVYIKYQS